MPTATPPLTLERERLAMLTLAGIQFSHMLDFMVMMPLGPILMHSLAVGPHEFGLLVSAYTFTAAISGLLVATFVDRFERKRLVLATLALFVAATLACGLAPGFWTLLVARGTAGAFGGVLGAMVQMVVGDIIPFERRGRASGTIMAAFSVSTVAGVPASLFLANHFGWRFPFIAIAIAACGFLALGWRVLPPLHGHLPAAGPRAHPFSAMGKVLREANHLRALGFMALLNLSSFTIIPYITIYMVGNVEVRQEDVPLIYLCGGVASFFSARWIGRMADRHGKVRVYRAVATAAIVPLLVQTHLVPVPLIVVLACSTVFFVLVPGRMAPAMAIITSAARPELRGTFLALSATVQQFSAGVAAVLGGLIIATDGAGRIVGYNRAGYLATAMALLAIAMVGSIRLPTRGKDLSAGN
jgi:predicted MFS family arabinose efflux permease